MRHPQPNIYGHSIVLIGNFNPKIFQPAWFGAEGLLGKELSNFLKKNNQIYSLDLVLGHDLNQVIEIIIKKVHFSFIKLRCA